MQTINNRMTETQISDLFSLAVQLQVKAEESDDRDTAILAYSIQNACSNLTESQREFRAADVTIHNLELKLTDMAVQLANAESKCRELAAENAEMRSSIDATIGWQESTDPENGESVRMLVDIKTPATDAFLAEVRAQGVEELASMAGNECKRYKSVNDRAGVRKWKSIVILCSDFATQLRKGAAL
ncbi:hypothetical protein ACSD87_002127 [Salmonella enterica subsp. enterica serovar Alachua]|nr:hypothetical protein [Salmonella enterica]WMZ99091.1 hypothetical protein IT836_14515 [Salmonella enterica subsp. enterica serovar Alachua]